MATGQYVATEKEPHKTARILTIDLGKLGFIDIPNKVTFIVENIFTHLGLYLKRRISIASNTIRVQHKLYALFLVLLGHSSLKIEFIICYLCVY